MLWQNNDNQNLNTDVTREEVKYWAGKAQAVAAEH